jgi:hypothetical protein
VIPFDRTCVCPWEIIWIVSAIAFREKGRSETKALFVPSLLCRSGPPLPPSFPSSPLGSDWSLGVSWASGFSRRYQLITFQGLL